MKAAERPVRIVRATHGAPSAREHRACNADAGRCIGAAGGTAARRWTRCPAQRTATRLRASGPRAMTNKPRGRAERREAEASGGWGAGSGRFKSGLECASGMQVSTATPFSPGNGGDKEPFRSVS